MYSRHSSTLLVEWAVLIFENGGKIEKSGKKISLKWRCFWRPQTERKLNAGKRNKPLIIKQLENEKEFKLNLKKRRGTNGDSKMILKSKKTIRKKTPPWCFFSVFSFYLIKDSWGHKPQTPSGCNPLI